MKNLTEEELSTRRPARSMIDTVEFCLEQLFEDTKHGTGDEVVNGLTFEELIGALLLARDVGREEQRQEEIRYPDNE